MDTIPTKSKKEQELLEDLLSDIYHSHNRNLRDRVVEGKLISIDDDYNQADLLRMEQSELESFRVDLDDNISKLSKKLVRLTLNQNKLKDDIAQNCQVVSAIIQAFSSKKSKGPLQSTFSVEPPSLTDRVGFNNWLLSHRSLLRMDAGLPSSWRKKIWLGLAQDYFQEVNLDRENLFPSLFNSTLTDDDKHLDYQIVKDLHRTANIGSRHDQQRLKRILLAYARYNPECGYCQGFNVIVALIMEVMESESDTLQVFIFMLHAVLPPEYHSHNLEGIQTDLKVLSDLMKTFTPKVNSHLINLRESSIRENGHEPPLASPYMMQWLLTAFGTFFPKKIVYRLWDGLLIDGNEILIRGILATWKCKEEDLLAIDSTDMFYQFMSRMVNTQSEEFICEKEFFKTIYSITAFPMKNLFSLRKKHRSGTLIQKSVPNSLVEEQGQIMKPKSSFSWWPTFGYTPVPRSTSFSTPLHSPDSPTEGDESPTKIQEKTLSKSTTSVKDEKPSINPRELEKQEIDKLYKNFNNARKPKIGINLFSRPSSSPIESIEKRTVFNHLCQSHQKISVKEQKSSFNRTKFTQLISSSSDSE